jgi:hypothetical protein
MIMTMAHLAWNAAFAEHLNTLQSQREAREHRRLLLRVVADFERSLDKPAAKTRPGPPQITLEEHMEMLRERREGAA